MALRCRFSRNLKSSGSDWVMPLTLRPFLLAGAALALIAGPASAETLREALLKAYQTNPTLNAARANQRANDENVPIARSYGLPQASLNGGYTETLRSASRSEEHTSELQSLMRISYAVFCLKKKKTQKKAYRIAIQRRTARSH